MISPIGPLGYLAASFEHASRRGASAAASAQPGHRGSVSVRAFEPPEVARLYLPHGLRAGQRAPGGSGLARAISIGGKRVAESGGSVFSSFDFHGGAARADKRQLERASSKYQDVAAEPAYRPPARDVIARYASGAPEDS